MTVFVSISRFVFQLAGMKTAFAIDNASKVGKIEWIVFGRNVQIPVFMVLVNELFHRPPIYKFIKQYTHEIILSPG